MAETTRDQVVSALARAYDSPSAEGETLHTSRAGVLALLYIGDQLGAILDTLDAADTYQRSR
jgi:hypothetical protein